MAAPPSNEILEREGCHRELSRIMDCNYEGVRSIGSWTNGDGDFLWTPTEDALPRLPPAEQAAHCRKSDIIVFKTVTFGHKLSEHAQPMLDHDPRLVIVDIVRDPRAIFASWRFTAPFSDIISGIREPSLESHDRDWLTSLQGICDAFAKNLQFNSTRVHRMRFEDLVIDPVSTVKDAYNFVGIPFAHPEVNWINSAFNAKCKDGDVGNFMNCHRNSTESVNKWRQVLSKEEQHNFTVHPACRLVASVYGYPLE